MARVLSFCAAACWLLFGAATPAAEVALNGHAFTLPDDFEIELVAGPPLVDRPITAALDEQGRLYVSDSSGSNDPVQKQLEERPHRILRLEDTDGDGRFDERTIYAEQMMFPEGTMWFDGSLYVAAPPSIWKLTDTDGDGVAEQREEWFQGKTLTGCANDLHGPYLGPDGWIYWCKGAFAEQTYQRPGKPPFVTRASHVFRCRPNGSGLEPVMTGGMDNPVDLVFTPTGERIFTTTFLVHPGGGLRDGLIHAIYGGVYGKDHGVLDGHPRTGDLMPVLVHLGPAAPCGLARTESTALGAEYQDNVFACSFNLHKITRHVVQPDGPALVASNEDFLVSNNLDFHPTDIQEDADGSLLICDTGGWYKLCCPTSQLWKPDLLGAIYRVRRRGAPRVEDARGLKLAWQDVSAAELTERLADPRPAVRERATQALAKLGSRAVGALDGLRRTDRAPAALRRQAVWGLSRIETDSSQAAVRAALTDSDESVRLAALHAVSLWRDGKATPKLLKMLDAGAPVERRLAAESLGRIGEPSAAPALLAAVGKSGSAGEIDRRYEHALIYALFEIDSADATRAGLAAADPATRRAALIALDQMPNGGLEATDVIALLSAQDLPVKNAAEWIARHHPEWGDAVVGYLRDRLAGAELSAQELAELEEQLVRFAGSATVQTLLGECLEQTSFPTAARGVALRAMARAGLKEPPARWLAALIGLLGREQGEVLALAVATVRALPPTKEPSRELGDSLLRVAQIDSLPIEVRLGALAAMPARMHELTPALFELIRLHVGADQPVVIRAAAADAVTAARLSREQLLALAGAFQTVGPLEVDRLLSAYEQSTDLEVGKALAAALRPAPALASLRPDAIKRRLELYGPELQAPVSELMAALNVDVAKQKARLEELLSSVSEGDVRRGQAVFHSAKASCLACHAMGYVGGRLGPDLTRIGQIRNERDLLEAIIFPSASFVRSYEPVSVVTADGKIHNGQIRLETPEAIVVVTGLNKEVRVERDEIEEILPSAISVMPSGLEQQLTRQNLADLVAFLKASK